ncbi:hypothetical protein BTUL_0312g00020 [Botrytis tulipae]|uniref:Uncharacterized protein n=1 Tax=Botrytis tulipae TaxID=87230 RepID=A0A4Z1E559_9HELO|nr:hypothetical protein BTUL_0312g00020 [Botrytis tulipae]
MLKNIKVGFAVSDRVLRSMPAPPAEPVIPKADEMKVGSYRQDIESQILVMPITAEAFISLQNLIIQQNVYTLDKTSKQNLTRHLQKCTKAFQISSARSILQKNRIQFLITINNKAKVRQSIRSLVLGKAKVMSYEDLEDAQAKCTIKESTQAVKGKEKRGRKRKSSTLEVDEENIDMAKYSRKHKNAAQDPLEPANKVMRASVTVSIVQISGIPIAEDEIVPETWRAPVARMY